jgi:hypothetical protein
MDGLRRKALPRWTVIQQPRVSEGIIAHYALFEFPDKRVWYIVIAKERI